MDSFAVFDSWLQWLWYHWDSPDLLSLGQTFWFFFVAPLRSGFFKIVNICYLNKRIRFILPFFFCFPWAILRFTMSFYSSVDWVLIVFEGHTVILKFGWKPKTCYFSSRFHKNNCTSYRGLSVMSADNVTSLTFLYLLLHWFILLRKTGSLISDSITEGWSLKESLIMEGMTLKVFGSYSRRVWLLLDWCQLLL